MFIKRKKKLLKQCLKAYLLNYIFWLVMGWRFVMVGDGLILTQKLIST